MAPRLSARCPPISLIGVRSVLSVAGWWLTVVSAIQDQPPGWSGPSDDYVKDKLREQQKKTDAQKQKPGSTPSPHPELPQLKAAARPCPLIPQGCRWARYCSSTNIPEALGVVPNVENIPGPVLTGAFTSEQGLAFRQPQNKNRQAQQCKPCRRTDPARDLIQKQHRSIAAQVKVTQQHTLQSDGFPSGGSPVLGPITADCCCRPLRT
ncbi:unnamed protein product [Boreogadus saida]